MHNLAPLAGAARLEALLDALVSAHRFESFAFGVAGLDGADLELAVLPTADPVASLIGLDAPPHWQAVGVVAAACEIGAHDDLVVGFAVDRDGNQCSELRSADVQRTANDPSGRIVDVCRRALGHDTAEATADTTALWTAQWLERILILVLDADLGAPRPSWSAIVDLHPAADGRATEAPELAFASCRRSLQLPWPVVRRRCAEGNVTIAGIDALDAAWMDDGMFSRFALDSYVPTPVVLDDLRELLPRATAERVRRTVELSVNR